MGVHTEQLQARTEGRSLVDITQELDRIARSSGLQTGLVNVFLKHTSASLIISENADPDVLVDLERYLSELGVDGDRRFTHTAEGPDDMSAHVRSVLTCTSISVPLRVGRLSLGTWQAVYLWEHRYAPHLRRVEVSIIGERA